MRNRYSLFSSMQMELITGRRCTWIHVIAIFMTVVASNAASADRTFPVRKYEDGTIAIVSNHTQITGSRTAFRGDVWLSKINGGKGGYLMETIKNTRKLNATLVSIKAQLRPVGCVENNTKSALFNFTTNEYFNCTCKTGWMGQDCATAAPSPPPSPPPPLFLTSLVEYATQPKLYASDAAVEDFFGSSLSLYGDTALIGAYFDDDNGKTNSGSVYVFTRSSTDGGTFTQQGKLRASDPAEGDRFGSFVSLYGDTALIGAPYVDDDVASPEKYDVGSVYVFTRSSTDDGTFTEQSKLHASDATGNDYFGMSVSLYGDTALIGAIIRNDDKGKSYSGSVYVFTRSSDDGTFTQQSKLHASDAAERDRFGWYVSLYGNTALIGAPLVDDDVASPEKRNVGSVYVFTRSSVDGGTFTQQSKLHASDAAVDDAFGMSVSLYGDTALIGAIGDDDNGKTGSGSVYVFKAPAT